jgi:hypothetical protein
MCYIKNISKSYNATYDSFSKEFPEIIEDQILSSNDVWAKNIQPPHGKNQYFVFNYSYSPCNSEQLFSLLAQSL